MVKRVDALTASQAAQLTSHAAKWIEIGRCTRPADRPAFEAAARKCYECFGATWHGKVLWVSSPPVVAQAGLLAAVLIEHCRPSSSGEEHERAPEGEDFDVLAGGRAVNNIISERVAEEVWTRVCKDMREVVEGAVDDATDHAIRGFLEDSPYEKPSAVVLGTVVEAVQSALRKAVDTEQEPFRLWMFHAYERYTYHLARRVLGGQLTAGSLYWGGALTSYFREVCELELPGDLWDRCRAYEQTIQSACYWYAHRDFLIVCERPQQIHTERRNPAAAGRRSHQLHRTDGPAISWPDGWRFYVLHGRRLPAWVIEHPQEITVEKIEAEHNAEIRRFMLDTYGWARYIRNCGARIVDEVAAEHEIVGLRGARLWRKELPRAIEPIVFLEMVNSSPEPDGSCKRYLERIDPKAYDGDAGRLCHAAMASRWHYRDENGRLQRTFERWQDYQPQVES